MTPGHTPIYDVFLSHNNADIAAVERIAVRLREAGLRPFLDKWHLVPGQPFIPAIEKALEDSQTVAAFFGPAGLSAWRDEEKQLALVHSAQQRDKRVIPVLLPGASKRDIEGFLSLRTWVDLEEDDGFTRFVAGVTGQAPELLTEIDVAHLGAAARIQTGSQGAESKRSTDNAVDSGPDRFEPTTAKERRTRSDPLVRRGGRSRTFGIGFGAVVLVIVASIGASSWYGSAGDDHEPPAVGSEISGPPPVTTKIRLHWPESSTHDSGGAPGDFRKPPYIDWTSSDVVWSQTVEPDGSLTLRPESEYLDDFRNERTIVGSFRPVSLMHPVEISILMTNDGPRNVAVSELSIEVLSSRTIREPILSVRQRYESDDLIVANYGSAVVEDSSLDLFAAPMDECVPDHLVPIWMRYPLGTVSHQQVVELSETWKERFHQGSVDFCIYGDLLYSTAGTDEQRHFRFIVPWLDTSPRAPGIPLAEITPSKYDFFMLGNESNLSADIAHEISPNEIEHIVARVSSNRSAVYELEVSVGDIYGNRLAQQRIILTMLWPWNPLPSRNRDERGLDSEPQHTDGAERADLGPVGTRNKAPRSGISAPHGSSEPGPKLTTQDLIDLDDRVNTPLWPPQRAWIQEEIECYASER